jgi:hypothetical protein
LLLSRKDQPGSQVPTPAGNQPSTLEPEVVPDGSDPIELGYNGRAPVVGGEVITARHRNITLLVAGCFFMEMLDGTNIICP